MSEQGDPEVFREAMSRLGAAVNLITTDGMGGRYGMIASSVCSVTDTPPTVLVCVNRSAAANAKLKANGHLCVNILAKSHRGLSDHFANAAISVEERFGAPDRWTRLTTGSPGLRDAAVMLDCRICEITEVGTHSVFFCQVLDVHLGQKDCALIYYDRAYHSLSALGAEAV